MPLICKTCIAAGLVLVAGSCLSHDKWGEDSRTSDTTIDTGWDTYVDTADVDTADTSWPDTWSEPDGEATCTVDDLVNQTMCGTGMKCTFRTLDGGLLPVTFCDVEGTQGWNETCGATATSDSCRAGYHCTHRDGDSRCRRYCHEDSLCTVPPGGAHAACRWPLEVGAEEAVGVRACTFSCDILATPSGCAPGQSCKGLKESGVWFTDCLIAGAGDRCLESWYEDCPEGMGCFFIDHSYNQCLRYCRLPTGSPSCPSGTCRYIADWPDWVGGCL